MAGLSFAIVQEVIPKPSFTIFSEADFPSEPNWMMTYRIFLESVKLSLAGTHSSVTLSAVLVARMAGLLTVGASVSLVSACKIVYGLMLPAWSRASMRILYFVPGFRSLKVWEVLPTSIVPCQES